MKNIPTATAPTPKELLAELQALVQEAEKLMGDSLSEHTEDAVSDLRQRLNAAQEKMGAFYDEAKTKVQAGAKCTDAAIRANPYQSLAIAVGVALLAGLLLGRRSL